MNTTCSQSHGGRDRMIKETAKKYVNITREAFELFKSYCEECQKKRKRPVRKGVVVRPILTDGFSFHGQVDLFDMQSMAQGSYKWIMVYQDHLTKLCVLRPLSSKRAAEVAHHLMTYFSCSELRTYYRVIMVREYTAEMISELKIIWPNLSSFMESLDIHRAKDPWKEQTVERAKTCWLHGWETKTPLMEHWNQVCPVPEEFQFPMQYSQIILCSHVWM
ncbi:KRAB-A domain-containing protein 2-like [Penaeus monodon]|uniref:KRAB-A domain-containing protein 2-like n=1 Tax=Penaeus monodon TaxID=6687 RepID=UPI0018A77589|nr:KRAB-A domain-containing protein 2-like [Penaeus monodon]